MTIPRTGAERIEMAVRNASASPAIIAYLTAGYPSRERFMDQLGAVARVSDVVEIGVPFSDPMADGATIQRASRAALGNGASLTWLLDELRAVRGTLPAPVVLMSYLNPLLVHGENRLAAAFADSGVDGLIVPDLPHEESDAMKEALEELGVALIAMVSPLTPPARLALLCAKARGFIYAVTDTATTGGSAIVTPELKAYLERVRAVSTAPVCAGFGIRAAAQVMALTAAADGVVVGSAIVEAIERGEDPAAFIRALRERN